MPCFFFQQYNCMLRKESLYIVCLGDVLFIICIGLRVMEETSIKHIDMYKDTYIMYMHAVSYSYLNEFSVFLLTPILRLKKNLFFVTIRDCIICMKLYTGLFDYVRSIWAKEKQSLDYAWLIYEKAYAYAPVNEMLWKQSKLGLLCKQKH